jgi:hypothetical protein
VHLNGGKPVHSMTLTIEEEEGHPRTAPADRQAGDVRGERARERLREQPAPGCAEGARHGEGAVVVPVCAAIEAEISQLEDADRAEFLRDLGLEEPGLNRVIRAGYQLLGLQTYFTAGVKEVRAWTIHAATRRRRRRA